MERIDLELVKRKLFDSRSRAQYSIKSGNISCNGIIIKKNNFLVSEKDEIIIIKDILPYVSKGGLKLEKAIKNFNINLNNKVALDIGASTGGFTECLLKYGAKKVIAVDVGTKQFSDKLSKDKRITMYEKTDIRNLSDDILNLVDLITIDISFISVKKILYKFRNNNSIKEIILLIKPQFECGKECSQKYKGVIKNKEIHIKIIKEIIEEFQKIFFLIDNLTFSPIKGGDGNIEYLAYFNKFKTINRKTININKEVDIAFAFFKDNKQ